MILNLTELCNDPLHEQIAAQILGRIIFGDHAAGEALEPARKVARRQHVSVSSVTRAYETLVREGAVRRTAKNGYVVAQLSVEERERMRRRHFADDVDPVEKQRLEDELETARQMQAVLLPKKLPDGHGVSFAAYSRSSRTVGGDFYDVVQLDRDRFGIVIADASGKGLPAAMMISQIHGMLRSEINHGNDIQTTLRNLNDHLAEFSGSEKFATLFYGVFNRSSGVLEYANAGHNHPIVVRRDGTIELLEIGGTILGIFPGVGFTASSITLDVGDTVFFYTDGVTETRNVKDEEYGEQRLRKLLQRSRDDSASEVIAAVLDDVRCFERTGPLHDDRTCLVLKALGSAARVH